MKTRTIIFKGSLLLFLVAITMTACNSDSLRENPDTFATPDQLTVDEDGAQIYLAGAYDAIQNTLGSGGNQREPYQIHWGTTATDEIVIPGWAADRKIIFLQQVTSSVISIRDLWKELYRAVNQANSVIDRVGASELIDAEVKAKILAEAKFIRAATYFALVVAWENVPLITDETISLDNLNVSQSTTEEVYAQIIDDLNTAASVLPSEQGGGRATKGSALALLGKVYLQMTGFPLNQTDKFAKAEAVLMEVMSSGVYALQDNYPEVFDLEDEQSSEIVFSFAMEGPGINEGGNLSTFYGPSGNVNNGGGWGTCYINQEFEASYDRDDIRLLNNVAKHNANDWTPEEGMYDPASWTPNAVAWRGWKWHAEKPNAYANDTPFDNPFIRYADVLLLYAEAKNGQGTLTQADLDLTVNKLRERARLNPEAVPDMVLSTQEANAAELLSERRKELCFEGWRRHDLIRFGKYKETILAIDQTGWSTAGNPGPNYEDHEIRWPIPISEMRLNPNLIQNDGY